MFLHIMGMPGFDKSSQVKLACRGRCYLVKRIKPISGNTSIWDMVNAGPANVAVAVDELVLVG